MIAVGLMSGTSLNGIDAALVRIVPAGDRYAIELLAFRTEPFGMELERKLRRALPPASATAGRLAELHRGLGRAFARAARAIVGKGPVGYVASHGQTIWHDGERGVTLQLGDPFAIRQAVEATVCYDFRSADCAEGGHGAPLVPYVDALLFADRSEDRVMLNLGGIANVTLIPRGASCGDVVAFDTGPANMLIDALVRERTNARESFDRDGALALAGAVDRAVLERMLSDEYFARPAPKTTGRERFGAQFLAAQGERFARLSMQDAAATLSELTAVTVAQAIRHWGFERAHVVASGGGTRNRALMRGIARHLPQARIDTVECFGMTSESKEAIAFAVLGYETLRGRAANLPGATGARTATPLGAIAPYRLRELLNEVERECRHCT